LHREIGRADSSVLFDVADGHWRWTVALGGQSVAVSAHAYKRRVECIRSLEQFIAAAAHAAPEPGKGATAGSGSSTATVRSS
jgi:hypothetical protein